MSTTASRTSTWRQTPAASRAPGRERRRRKGLAFRLVRLVFAGVLGYVLVTAARIGYAGAGDHRQRSDVIVVLGAAQFNGRPSPVYKARLEHAVRLYKDGYAPRILFTGGKQPGDTYTEASAGRLFALRHGVPDSAILEEREGRTTLQSMSAAASILKENHLHTALLVSDPFHALRLGQMARDLDMEARFSPAENSRIQSMPVRARFTLREVVVYTAYRLFRL